MSYGQTIKKFEKMRTNKLTITAFVLMLLFVTASFAQGGRNNKSNLRNNQRCLNVIPNLTTDQTTEIGKLQQKHWDVIDGLRQERQSTFDERTKAEIRIKMLDEKDRYQAELKSLLNDDQQIAYNTIQKQGQGSSAGQTYYNGGRGRNCTAANVGNKGKGRHSGRGNQRACQNKF